VPAPPETGEAIPLLPRRRLIGSVFGGHASIRRGEGSDIAGSRPYQPGDHYHSIDWKSSARLTSLRGDDEFIVRERFSEEMPRVVLVCDRRPEMALYPRELPWLDKRLAVRNIVSLVVRSAVNQRGLVGYLDYGSHEGESDAGSPFWRPPRAQSSFWHGTLAELTEGYLGSAYDAPADNLASTLAFLTVVRSAIPTGSFVFVLSDFLIGPPYPAWAAAFETGWDVVAVIIQDPVWEQSFPPLGGVLAPVVDARNGGLMHIRMTEGEAAERRTANEDRLRNLLRDFSELGLDPILVSADDPAAIRASFLEWAERRLALRGVRQ
jgi:Protein of unknown function DUF58